ncbi:hypothetical protein L6164_020564 [Bauhinia variegata]|uniref:Uncharacterized protein n=1 Tax=Bauhinia variegata TaxID=167791 RepID=A0ACB9MX35_BAUVA|nr:hypothetical protein L6164_020564 [Bauhinia variegata]
MARLLLATLLLLHMILLSCNANFFLNPFMDPGNEGALADPEAPFEEEPDAYNLHHRKKKIRKQRQQKKKNDGIGLDWPQFPLLDDPIEIPPEVPQNPLPDAPKNKLPEDPQDALPDGPPDDNLKGLRVGFYNQSCPRAEEIMAETMAEMFRTNPRAPANILRLQFHDCFVGGCDASILLDSTPSGENVEKSSPMNFILLKGADLIDDIKLKLEQECPQTVSCADIIAFAAREALALTGLPRLPQPGGRRDALVSLSANVDVLKNLPIPDWTMDQLIELFKRKGFTEEEMVILTGAHSIGGAHCGVFTPRLNNYENSGKPDPGLDPAFLNQISGICLDPKEANRNPLVDFDETPTKMDNLFYKNLMQYKALLSTDQALLTDPRTAQFVEAMANNPDEFAKRLAALMIRMGAMEALTGTAGEVRKTCRSTV